MMKLSFSTLGCPEWSYDQVLENAENNGYEGVEIRGILGEMRADKIPCFAIGHQREAVRKAEDHGIKLIGFGATSFFHDPSNLENALDDARSAIDVAAALGMSFIRVFGDRIQPDEDENVIMDRVGAGIRTLCRYAEGSGVKVLQECHGNFNYAHRLLGVAERVDSANYGIIWDVAHSDKTCADEYEAFYRKIKPLVYHVHFKDHHRANGEYRLCTTGVGDIPLIPIARMLEKDGYQGYISLEWEKVWHPDLRSAAEEFPHFARYMKENL